MAASVDQGLGYEMGFYQAFSHALGLELEPKELGVLQVCLRGAIVFLAALVMVRLSDRRFMSKMTAFDVILGFMLASALARAINGSAPFFPTLVMGFVLIGLHRLLAKLAVLSEGVGFLVKGKEDALVHNGQLDRRRMRALDISEKDLLEAARHEGQVETLGEIKTAVLERSGKISVIPDK
jgi:uncharacterized membrane protein YcaP (DUF421 family)